jgi:hypothetical protein
MLNGDSAVHRDPQSGKSWITSLPDSGSLPRLRLGIVRSDSVGWAALFLTRLGVTVWDGLRSFLLSRSDSVGGTTLCLFSFQLPAPPNYTIPQSDPSR